MYMHTYVQTYLHKYMHTCICIYIHTYIHTCIHTYKHTYTNTCIHVYVYTYIHIYISQAEVKARDLAQGSCHLIENRVVKMHRMPSLYNSFSAKRAYRTHSCV